MKQVSVALLRSAVLAVFILAAGSGAYPQDREHWVGTWATAPVARLQTAPAAPAGAAAKPPLNFANQTLRQIVRVSAGGSRVRVVFSNAFGTAPLAIGAAHVGLRQKDAAVGSGRPLTFDGRPAVTIPPGAVVVSDAAALAVPPRADLAIDLYLPGDTAASPSPLTTHNAALQTNYASMAGNHAGVASLPVATTMAAWFFVTRVEVDAAPATRVVVAFGDSITDGARSTVDTNNRWPDHLAERLSKLSPAMAVLNAGIAGNFLLSDRGGVNALARFDRDVLAHPGVTHLFVLEGINDIGGKGDLPAPTAEDLIAAHKQLIARARAHGLTVYAGTLLPFQGGTLLTFTSESEARRQALNTWLRTSKAYDAVVDFDAALRDPAQPTRVLPKYISEDFIHPNDAGYKVMGDLIDASLFAPRR